MSSSALFQSKLVSVMEILVNSAVADICRVVDDGAAVLHFEISRSKSENEDLRLKLQLMQRELETVRRGRERSLKSVGIQCVDFSERQELSITIKQEQQNGLQGEKEERTAANNIIGGDWSLGLPEHSARTDRSGRTGLAKESTHNHDTRHHRAKRNLAQVNSHPPERPTEGHYEVGGPKTVGHQLRRDSRSGSPSVRSHREESSLSLKSEDKPSCERVGKDDDKHPQEQQQHQQQLPFSPSEPYADLRDKIAFPSDVCEVEYELDDEVCNLGDQGSFISGHQTRPKQEQEGEGSGIGQVEHAPPPDVSPRCLYQAASDLTFALQAVAGGGMPAAGVAPPPQSGPSAARPHVCPQCGRGFAHSYVLKRHLVVHSGLRPHACGLCGKRFSLRDSLRRHQRIHTGERPYGCQLCGKRFTQRTHLNIHLSVHTGIRPFTCTHCGRSFTQTHVLRRHMRVHASEGLSFYQEDS